MTFIHQLGLDLYNAPTDDAAGGISLPLDSHFDVEFANEIARLEAYNKHHYRPNTYLHKWWARRCGTTFRLILKHLVENEAQRGFYLPGGLEGKVILDPMMGGGTTLHEAIRLGANVIGVDIDPIPVLQARATLSDVPLSALESAFGKLLRALTAELGPLFRTTCPTCAAETAVRFTLYGLRRRCACGPVVSVDSLILRYQPDGAPVRLCPRCHDITIGQPCSCTTTGRAPLVERATAVCSTCNDPYEDEDVPHYARYVPLAIAGDCPKHPQAHGLFFARPRPGDLANLAAADARRGTLSLTAGDSPLDVASGPKSDSLLRREVTSYLDLFSSRQLIYLATAQQLMPSFDPLVRLNLALLVSTSLEFNSMLCGYKGRGSRRPGAIRHTFSHHAYAFPHTALENNPLYPRLASGTLRKLFQDRLRRARQWALQPVERRPAGNRSTAVPIVGETDIGVEVADPADFPEHGHGFYLIQGTAANLTLNDDSVDYVITDPPYFDSVQYSDLAGFFRVWLRQLLPEAADWGYDFSQSAVMLQINGDGPYGSILGAIFAECYRVLRKRNGRLIFTYHHWNPKSWTALTLALRQAGFVLLNRYAVYSENPISVHISNMKALTHDAILVLAPADSGRRIAWERPPAIDHDDSERFCRDCGTLLGWLLNGDLTADAIREVWHGYLDYNARPGAG